MKKLTMISMAALLLMAVSCKKDKQTEEENAGSGFRATVESHAGDSKTHLDGVAVKWDSNDEIMVQSSTCTAGKRFAVVQIEEGGTAAGFNPAETLPEGFYSPNYTAYYPAGMMQTGTFTLPATQTYAANGFGNGANPMIAVSDDKKMLAFKNICGLLKLELYSSTACQVRSISITSNTGEQLCGTGTVTFTGGIPTLGALTGGGTTLTLDMGTGGEFMSIEADSPSVYYFVVPAGTLGTSFTVKVTETNGNVWSQIANATQNKIVRSQITKMPTVAVTTKPDIPESALPGLFSVGEGKQVYFSKGNLQYNMNTTAGAAKWRFALNQYECIGSANKANVQNTTATEDTWIDLFGWGTSGWDNGNHFYQPYDTDKSTYDITVGYGYGPTDGNSYNFNLTGNYAKADWGVNNGGGSTWRTLTKDEWVYLIDNRKVNEKTGYGYTCAWATVEGVGGLIIFPDDYTSATSGLRSIPDGCVFLPAAGDRSGTSVRYVGSNGYYWSSSYFNSNGAYYLYFYSGSVGPNSGRNRYYGCSVRLVSDVPTER